MLSSSQRDSAALSGDTRLRLELIVLSTLLALELQISRLLGRRGLSLKLARSRADLVELLLKRGTATNSNNSNNPAQARYGE